MLLLFLFAREGCAITIVIPTHETELFFSGRLAGSPVFRI